MTQLTKCGWKGQREGDKIIMFPQESESLLESALDAWTNLSEDIDSIDNHGLNASTMQSSDELGSELDVFDWESI